MFCVPMSQNIKETFITCISCIMGMIFLLNYFVYMDFSNYEHIPYYYFHNITSSFKI